MKDQSYIDRNIPEDLERESGGSQIEFRLEEMMDEAETPEEAAVIRKMILNERNRDPNQIGKFGEIIALITCINHNRIFNLCKSIFPKFHLFPILDKVDVFHFVEN